MKDDRLYLAHIWDCLQRIDEYAGGGRDAFLASTMIQDAVIRNLQTLAASTQRLSPALQAAHPEVPWRQLSGFRNVVVHDYLGVDLETIWTVVEQHVPQLRKAVGAMTATTLRNAFPPAEHLGDAESVQRIVDWLRDLILAGVLGNFAYDMVKGSAIELLRAFRRKRGAAELEALKQRVFEELECVNRQPTVAEATLRRRVRELFENVGE